MKYKVVLENKARGEVQFPLVMGSAKVIMNRQGTPTKLECDLVRTEGLNFQEGNALAFYVEETLFFYGYVISKSRTSEQIIRILCYDQLFYFKNKDILQYKDLAYSELLKKICAKNHLTTGEIEDTKFKIPGRIEDNKEYHVMLQYASDLTTAKTGEIYVLFDDAGKITLKNIKELKVSEAITYNNAEDFDYKSSIEKGVYNRVHLRLIDEHKKEIKSSTAEDKKNIAEWGLLNYSDITTNKDLNLDTTAKELLKVLNRKHRELKIKNAIGNLKVRAGSLVPVHFPEIGEISVQTLMMVNAVVHTFEENHHSMDLEVVNADIQPSITPKTLGGSNRSGSQAVAKSGTAASVALQYMKKHIGAPYSQNGTLRRTTHFDCSSAVMRAYQDAGVLPRKNYNLTTASILNDKHFYEINRNQLQPGDICWRKGHMELYAGGDKTIGAHSNSVPLGYSTLKRSKPFTRFFRVKTKEK